MQCLEMCSEGILLPPIKTRPKASVNITKQEQGKYLWKMFSILFYFTMHRNIIIDTNIVLFVYPLS